MKILKSVFAICLCMLFLTTFSYGQRTSTTTSETSSKKATERLKASKSASEVRVVRKDSYKKEVNLISNTELKRGVNYMRVNSTFLEVIKTRGVVKSVKQVSNTGQLGPNLMMDSTPQLISCTGEDDCIDLMGGTACDGKTSICIENEGEPVKCHCW